MNFFNRREVFVTYNLQLLEQARESLRLAGIKYYIKTINRRSPSPFCAGTRGHTGTAFEKMEYEYTYYLYVHKNDYDDAIEIVRGR